MLINAFISLVSYLPENIGKNPIISYEIKSSPLTQDEILTKRNVYYIILDGMQDIETTAQLNIANKKEVLDDLSNAGLKYIDKSRSSYNISELTLASIILIDYQHKLNSPIYGNKIIYPKMMHKMHNLPLISYLKKANSSFFWSGNNWIDCQTSKKWSCINLSHDFSSLFKFYSTTLLPKIYKRIFYINTESHNSIDKFLKYIDNSSVSKTPLFAFIHHVSPHQPFLVTNECEPTNHYNLYKQNYEGYKASYLCTLKKVQIFMEKINNIDPEAIVVFQGDHGVDALDDLDLELTNEENYQMRGKIFNAIKAPEICFKKYGLPKTNVNTVRFTLNCAYGFKLPYRKNSHYEKTNDGKVVEKYIYE